MSNNISCRLDGSKYPYSPFGLANCLLDNLQDTKPPVAKYVGHSAQYKTEALAMIEAYINAKGIMTPYAGKTNTIIEMPEELREFGFAALEMTSRPSEPEPVKIMVKSKSSIDTEWHGTPIHWVIMDVMGNSYQVPAYDEVQVYGEGLAYVANGYDLIALDHPSTQPYLLALKERDKNIATGASITFAVVGIISGGIATYALLVGEESLVETAGITSLFAGSIQTAIQPDVSNNVRLTTDFSLEALNRLLIFGIPAKIAAPITAGLSLYDLISLIGTF